MNVSEAIATPHELPRLPAHARAGGDRARDPRRGARQSPSGGNLQPWRVYALTGAPLAEFVAIVRGKLRTHPRGDGSEYEIYPTGLWEPYRSRRFKCGEDMYATIGVAREDKLAACCSSRATTSSSARRWACSSASTGAWVRRSGPTSACTCRA